MIDKYLINENSSILDALKHMDENEIKYLIVEDCHNKVVGTLTDGDIRRGILKGIHFNNSVQTIANFSFFYLDDNEPFVRVIDIFRKNKIDFIPIVDSSFKLINIVTRHIVNALLLTNKKLNYLFDFDSTNNTQIEHEIFVRPWGYYKTMVLNEMFQSKIIYILPGQSISLQSHNRREEYWTIINGSAKIQLDESIKTACPGDMFFIPKMCKHRLTNTSSDELLVFSEVQLGNYFGEDDIERYEDDYGRS